MKLSELQKLISESIHKCLMEGEYEDRGTIEDIMYNVEEKAELYEIYAKQWRNEIKVVGSICKKITEALSAVFGVRISTEDFHTCVLENARLEMYISIPRDKFALACRNINEIHKIHDEEYGGNNIGDDTSWVECGISYGDWGELIEEVTGIAIIYDKYHKFFFEPWKEQNNAVICSATIDGAFAQYN